jgi:hypothetical protein
MILGDQGIQGVQSRQKISKNSNRKFLFRLEPKRIHIDNEFSAALKMRKGDRCKKEKEKKCDHGDEGNKKRSRRRK